MMIANYKLIIFVVVALTLTSSLHINLKWLTSIRALKTTAATTLTLTAFSFAPMNNLPVDAIDALDAATRAMLQKSDRNLVDNRSFDQLPLAAKKRKALALCKEDATRRAAGYSSAADCNSKVLAGNFDIATRPSPVSSISSGSKAKVTVASEEVVSYSSNRPTKKVTDLSDLTIAQKKRRALAACKRPEVRKFASAGSESKCSTSANRGEYEAVIEALEYGI